MTLPDGEEVPMCTVDDVLITDELARRPSREPDYAAENEALVALAQELTTNPGGVLQKVAELVLRLCRADSAGISILEREGGDDIFRWHAAAGRFAPNLWGTMPRASSPCGTVITRNSVLLFNEAERFFPALRGVEPRIYENLLAPWEVGGKVTGTVWVIGHSPEHRFDAEDARLLRSLARFAGAAYGVIERTRVVKELRAERLAALNLMEDAIIARHETERADAALRKSEENYRTLFDSIDEGFCTIEVLFDENEKPVDYRFLQVNPAFERHTGIKNAVGRTMREIAPQHEEHWYEIYGRVALTGEAVRFENKAAALGFWYDVYAFRIDEPKLRRVGILFNDITERKRSEEALRESQAELAIELADTQQLQRISSALVVEDDIAAFYQQILEAARAVMRSDFASIQMLVPERNELFLLAHQGFAPESAKHWEWVNIAETTSCGLAMSSGERIIVPDVEQWDFVAGTEDLAHYRLSGIRATQSTRLVSREGRLVGMLSTHWREPHNPSERELIRFDVLARQVADLIERRQAEQALRESEERLQKAMSIETVGVIFFNAKGVIHHANEAFARMSGYSQADIRLGKVHWNDLTPPEFMEASLKASEELKTKGQSTPYEKQYLRPDTSRWWGLFAGKRLGEGEFVEFVLDVTDRKNAEAALRASEERLRLVVESVEDYAILTMDAEGRIVSWNPGAERMFGYSEEEAMGQNARIIFTPEDQERGVPEDEMRRARREGRAPDERWHLSKRGVYFYLSGILAPLRDAGGELTGYAKIARDLTERKELEEALRRAHDELEERVRERTRELQEMAAELLTEVKERAQAEGRARALLGQIVTIQEEERRRIARELHDTLGQQLAALSLSMDMIKAESEGGVRLREHINRTQSIFDRLNSDVDFLAWELRPAALDTLGLDVALQTFVREWSEHFGVSADYRGSGNHAPRLTPEVETNLYRILQEALQNVHKHAGADHVSVQLEQRDGRVVLVVEDNGKGYDPDDEVAAGSNKGMGVANMRERAALVGGALEVESTPGAGTTIFVRVPLGALERGGEGA